MTNFQDNENSGVQESPNIDISQHDYDQLQDQFETTPQKTGQGYDVLGDQFADIQDDGTQNNSGIAETNYEASEETDISAMQTNSDTDKEMQSLLKDLGNVDINEFKDEISRIVKNPNPFALYSEINKIKDKFSAFINYITKKIIEGFNTSSDGSANNRFIISIYYESNYQKVWLNNLKEYLIECKYFDLNIYFKSALILEPQKRYLAKGLLKIYKGETPQEVKNMLYKSKKCRLSYEKIKNIADMLRLDLYKGQIESKYLDEDEPEIFLSKLSQIKEIDFDILIKYFDLNLANAQFDNMYKIFVAIAKTYIRPGKRNYMNYITDSRLKNLKLEADNLIKSYNGERRNFKYDFSDIFYRFNLLGVEEEIFYNYIQTQIIDIYYPKVNNLFYRNKEACRSRNDRADLKGEFILKESFNFKKEIDGLIEFKKLILEIDKNILGTFLRPIIYKALSDELNIKKKDLYKIRYIMTLIIADTYKEYKLIYRFFEELECFLNYNDNIFNFSKLKLFSSNIILLLIVLISLYMFAPIGVFISSLILILIGAYEVVKPFDGGVKWNFGFKSFAMALFVFSLFLWFLNLESTKKQVATTTANIEKIGIYKTDEVVSMIDQKIDKSAVSKAYADILKAIFK